MKNITRSGISVSALVVAGALSMGLMSCDIKKGGMAPPVIKPTVEVTKPVIQDVPVYKEWVGNLTGQVNATIVPQVTGYLEQQVYNNGQAVKKGDVLFRIDERTFQATLEQAQGELARAKAVLTKNMMDVERYTPLAATAAVSKKQLDDSIQATKESKAEVEAAQANVEKAQLNVGFCVVRSPIDGIAGIAKAQIGDLVSPGGMILTQVSQVNPIRLDFAITEQDWLNTADKSKADGNMMGDFIEIILSNKAVYSHKGKIIAIDREVNSTTGTINLVGQIDNPESLLRPGMFVTVRAKVESYKNAMLVPAKAVVEQQGAYFVVSMNEEGAPAIIPVKAGANYKNMRIITPLYEGMLTTDNTIVVTGTMQAMRAFADNSNPINAERPKQMLNMTPYLSAENIAKDSVKGAAPSAAKEATSATK